MIDSNTEPANELLGQFKVLDFSSVMDGPFCTRLMAELIAPTSQRNFEQSCDAIDQPDLKLDVRFTKQRIREQYWPELLEIVEQWTSTRMAKVCEEHFLSHGVPCSRYNSVGDLLDDAQALHRETFQKIEDAAGALRVTNPPFRFSKRRALAQVDDRNPDAG
jgi:CoA:oxalate CoA-transferase